MPTSTAPEMRVSSVLVVAQQLADARHAEPEEHEDRCRTRARTATSCGRRAAVCAAGPSSSVDEVEAGDHREVGGHERQHARREERDDPAAERGEVREDADIVEARTEREQRRHVPILCATRRPSGPYAGAARRLRGRRRVRNGDQSGQRAGDVRPLGEGGGAHRRRAAASARPAPRRWPPRARRSSAATSTRRRPRRPPTRSRPTAAPRSCSAPTSRKRADVDALVDRAASEFGRVDIVGNIAGVPHNKIGRRVHRRGVRADPRDQPEERLLRLPGRDPAHGPAGLGLHREHLVGRDRHARADARVLRHDEGRGRDAHEDARDGSRPAAASASTRSRRG